MCARVVFSIFTQGVFWSQRPKFQLKQGYRETYWARKQQKRRKLVLVRSAAGSLRECVSLIPLSPSGWTDSERKWRRLDCVFCLLETRSLTPYTHRVAARPMAKISSLGQIAKKVGRTRAPSAWRRAEREVALRRKRKEGTMCACDSSREKSMPMTSLVTFRGWWCVLWARSGSQVDSRTHSHSPSLSRSGPRSSKWSRILSTLAASSQWVGRRAPSYFLASERSKAPHRANSTPLIRRWCFWSPRFCCWRRVLCSRPTSSPTPSLSASTVTTANKWPTASPKGLASRVGARWVNQNFVDLFRSFKQLRVIFCLIFTI